MPNWDNFVYSYVPRMALDNILEEGLFGGKALLKRPDLLEIAARGREQTAKQLESQIEKDLEAPEHESLLGPNVTFCLIPDLSILDRNHPVIKHKLIPIKINLTELLFDYPETKIFGLELEPFSDEVTEKERYHYLDRKELDFFLSMDAKEMWSRYNDIDGKGLYAPDVPHASIHTKDGIVPARYIEKISKKAQMNPSDLIDIVKQRVKKSDAVKKVFEKYKLDIDEIDLAPVCFADLDVSARTDHAIIYLNWQLLDGDPNNIDHYLAHEFTHFCQQTTGNSPTKGSTDDTYLDNPAEQEGFSAQTEYLSETRDPEIAEEYIENVLDHHDIDGKERSEKRKKLLRLNCLDTLQSLSKIARKSDDLEILKNNIGNYIHFSDSDRFGISYHKNIHPGNPRGVYGFPLTSNYFQDILNNRNSFYEFGYGKYIYIFSVNGNILNLDNINLDEMYVKIKSFLEQNYPVSVGNWIKFWQQTLNPKSLQTKYKSAEATFLEWLYNIFTDYRRQGLLKNEHSAMNIFLRGAGYDAMETKDYGFGDHIRSEIVVLNPSSVNLIAKITNPLGLKEIVDDAAQVSDKQLPLEFPMVRSKEELMRQYDDAVETGPKHNHNRNVIVRPISKLERQHRLERLQSLMQKLETKTSLEPMSLTKEAGLLKVPVALLQDVFVWLDSVYAGYIKNLMLEKIKKRTDIPSEDELNNMENKMDEVYWRQSIDFVLKITESIYDKYNVINTTDKFPFSITLSRQKKDDAVEDRYGYIDDEYDYLYNIDFKSDDINITQHNIDYDTAEKLIYGKIINFFKEMKDYIWECKNLRDAYSDTIINEQLLLKECDKYITNDPQYINNTESINKKFSYKNYFSNTKFDNYKVTIFAFFEFKTMAAIAKSNGWESGIGYWIVNQNPLYNDIWVNCEYNAEDVESFNSARQMIHQTARHELQHLVQDQIRKLKNMNELGGLPSKKIRNPEYDLYGNPTTINKGKERQDHALRDIEFYTRLSDEVQSFKNRYQYRKDNDKYELAKKWTGLIGSESSSFFKQLRENAPNKWKKAIKEFFKAIGD